jgi:transposase InsO family protein
MVEQMVSEKIEVKLTCLVLEVSRSGFYDWMTKPESQRKIENEILVVEIKRIHDESRGTYGLPRICETLKQDGKKHGKGRINRLMKTLGISGVFKNSFKIKTTDSKHDNPIADRIFETENKDTHATKPNEVWVSDITYIHTDEGFLFLGTYLDLFTRKLVGFSMADHMRTELLLDALSMALGRQNLNTADLLAHSDRGSQYASEIYRERLKTLGITASMSRKGNCYDNAFAETFFGTLKNELIYRTHFKTRQEAMIAIFEYIEVFYNRKRIHSSLGYLTPVAYEQAQLAA